MTRKEAAKIVGVNEKTYREYVQFAEANEVITAALTEEQKSNYPDFTNRQIQDRKNGASMKQFRALAALPPEIIQQTIAKMMENPNQGKAILLQAIGNAAESKVTVTLPAKVNAWYTKKADKAGKSKGKYIYDLLLLIYLSEKER